MAGHETGATPQRLHVRIAGILAAEIASGLHRPGQHLVELHLAERFGVSRTPVRLALARLAEAGLLDYLPARGHTVRECRPDSTAPDAGGSAAPHATGRTAGAQAARQASERDPGNHASGGEGADLGSARGQLAREQGPETLRHRAAGYPTRAPGSDAPGSDAPGPDGRGSDGSSDPGTDGPAAADVGRIGRWPGDRDRGEPGSESSGAGPHGLGARHAWETIHARVEEAITARIVFGSWHVPETVLARTFGVSRTVARDVLARLQGRGLVEMQGGRWVAPGLDARRVDELYRLRALLEPAALREIGSGLPPGLAGAAIARLEAASAAPPDAATLDALEQELHVDLLALCCNATLISAIRQPQSLLIAHRFLYRATSALFGTEPFIPEHLEVFRALDRGRVDAAARHLHDHLLASRTRAVRRLDALRGAAPTAGRAGTVGWFGPEGPGEVAYLRPIPPER